MLGFGKEGRLMGINIRSIRTKALLLVAGVAIMVSVVSVVYFIVAGGAAITEQLEKRGRYIASNLALNAKLGVLSQDRPLLVRLLEDATGAAGGEEGSDVVGLMIRDASGGILVQAGKEIRNLPAEPATELQGGLEAVTTDGEAVLLFRAPVTMGDRKSVV